MKRRRAALTRSLALALFAVCAAATSCAARTVSLRVSGGQPDATVTIDDQELGSFAYVQKRGVALPEGKHRITVEKPGYFPFDVEVEAAEQPLLEVKVELQKIPD